MGKIFYSLAGEGRGHATRVRTVVEELRHNHEIVLFAPHVAFEFLDDCYRGVREVQVRRIPGLQFCYKNRRISYLSSVCRSIPYLVSLPDLVDSMERMLRDEQPDLIITDFEPSLPRAAKRLGLPFVSFDHQHFLTAFDLSSLPWALWLTDQDLQELLVEVEKDLKSLPFGERLAKRYYLRGIRNRLLKKRGSPNPSCVALNAHLRIFPNGDVPTCQFNSRVVGNLRQNSFREIWNCVAAKQQRDWVKKCPGCWAECEVLPSAIYTLDLLKPNYEA